MSLESTKTLVDDRPIVLKAPRRGREILAALQAMRSNAVEANRYIFLQFKFLLISRHLLGSFNSVAVKKQKTTHG